MKNIMTDGTVEEMLHFSYPACALNVLKQSQSVGNFKSHHLVSWIFLLSLECFRRILSVSGRAFQPGVQILFESQTWVSVSFFKVHIFCTYFWLTYFENEFYFFTLLCLREFWFENFPFMCENMFLFFVFFGSFAQCVSLVRICNLDLGTIFLDD